MSKPELLLTLFQQVITGTSTESIKQAQLAISSFDSDPQFLSHILFLLEQPQVSNNVKKLGCVYLNRYSHNLCKQKNIPKIMVAIDAILQALASFQITNSLKKMVVMALSTFINNDASNELKSKLVPNLLRLLQESKGLTDGQVRYEYIAFYGIALLRNQDYSAFVEKLIETGFEPTINLTQRLQNCVVKCSQQSLQQQLQQMLPVLNSLSYLVQLFLKRMHFINVSSSTLLYKPELATLLTSGFALTLPDNLIQSTLFYTPSTLPSLAILNQLKANYFVCLNNILKTLNIYVKDNHLLKVNPIFQMVPSYLKNTLVQTATLLKTTPYYKVTQLSILKIIDQILNFFTTALHFNDFYMVFQTEKDSILESIVFNTLCINPNDVIAFYEDAEEFVNGILQFVGRDEKIYKPKGAKEKEAQDKEYETMRTMAVEFLISFCKYQDGIISEMFRFAFAVLEKQMNTIFPRSLMLIVICVLKDLTVERSDIHSKLAEVLISLLNETQLPTGAGDTRSQTDVEYFFLILTLEKYFIFLKDRVPSLVDKSFNLVSSILNTTLCPQPIQMMALNIIQKLNMIQEGDVYSPRILEILNNVIKNSNDPSLKVLETCFEVIKFNDDILQKNVPLLVNTIAIMSDTVAREVRKDQPLQLRINKCWNILRELGQSDTYIPTLIPPIEAAIMPLLPFIDGLRNWDFEEDVLMIMSFFIKKTQTVTPRLQQMFEIIPKIFYNQYSGTFGHSFETIQNFIHYGKPVLQANPAAVQAIISMCLVSLSSKKYHQKALSEADNSEGVLILQTLVMTCGDFFGVQIWQRIASAVESRLQEQPRHSLLITNLIALLSLVFVYSHKTINPDFSVFYLGRILNGLQFFEKSSYSSKVFIFSLCQIMLDVEHVYVLNRFSQIIDTIVTLLQTGTIQKTMLFEEQDETDEQRDYNNLLLEVTNGMKDADEFNYFKAQLEKLKQKNTSVFHQGISQLPASKKEFLKNIMSFQRVMNKPRQIYKIKRPA